MAAKKAKKKKKKIGPKRASLRGMFESKSSGQKAFVRSTDNDGAHVFIRLEPQGSNGDMPTDSFLRQYRRIPKSRK
jgi:hypothetical protein